MLKKCSVPLILESGWRSFPSTFFTAYVAGPLGWESIPGLIKRFTNTGSGQIYSRPFHGLIYIVDWPTRWVETNYKVAPPPRTPTPTPHPVCLTTPCYVTTFKEFLHSHNINLVTIGHNRQRIYRSILPSIFIVGLRGGTRIIVLSLLVFLAWLIESSARKIQRRCQIIVFLNVVQS